MISPSNDRNFPAMEQLLSWTSQRQEALSSNITNLDTPGYHAKDYSFQSELEATLKLTTTSEKHIAPLRESANSRVYEVGMAEKPNGNDVDIERELTEITKNGLEYITFIQYLNQKIKTLRTAIVDGGR
jgi:flagellar basal-body rod protein FlgB